MYYSVFERRHSKQLKRNNFAGNEIVVKSRIPILRELLRAATRDYGCIIEFRSFQRSNRTHKCRSLTTIATVRNDNNK